MEQWESLLTKVGNTNVTVNQIIVNTASMEVLSNKVIEENEALKTEVKELKNKLSQMQDEVDNLEKCSRKNNILIQGVPCSEEENVCNIVKSLGTSVGMQIHDYNLCAVHRLPAKNETTPPSQ